MIVMFIFMAVLSLVSDPLCDFKPQNLNEDRS